MATTEGESVMEFIIIWVVLITVTLAWNYGRNNG